MGNSGRPSPPTTLLVRAMGGVRRAVRWGRAVMGRAAVWRHRVRWGG